MNYHRGDSYEGGWMDGMMSGEGIYKWKDGSEYEGGWSRDERHGYGIQKWPNGKVEYKGN